MNGEFRKFDEAGRLIHAGFFWTQPIPWREKLVTRVFMTTTITAAVISPFIMYCWANNAQLRYDRIDRFIFTVFVLALTLSVLQYACSRWLFYWWNQKVGLSFSVWGEIWKTRRRGFFQKYDTLDWFCLNEGWQDISSISFKPMLNISGGHYRHGGEPGYLAYDVWVLFENGRRFLAAEYLDEDDAHVVVAQLNIARQEIRKSAAQFQEDAA